MANLRNLCAGLMVALVCNEASLAFSVPRADNVRAAILGESSMATRRNFVGAAVASVAVISGLPTKASAAVEYGGSIKFGSEEIMSQKAHGTSSQPVQSDLLYGVSNKLADKICNFNR